MYNVTLRNKMVYYFGIGTRFSSWNNLYDGMFSNIVMDQKLWKIYIPNILKIYSLKWPHNYYHHHRKFSNVDNWLSIFIECSDASSEIFYNEFINKKGINTWRYLYYFIFLLSTYYNLYINNDHNVYYFNKNIDNNYIENMLNFSDVVKCVLCYKKISRVNYDILFKIMHKIFYFKCFYYNKFDSFIFRQKPTFNSDSDLYK